MAKIKGGKRTVYGLVGLAGVYGLFTMWGDFGMSLATVADSLLVIGGLNWGIVSVTGESQKDLLGLMGLK